MELLDLHPDIYEPLAQDLFLRFSGTDQQGKKYERMREAAFRLKEKIADHIHVQAGYVCYDSLLLSDSTVEIQGIPLHCSAFEQLDPTIIHGAYVYAVSAGHFELPDYPVIDQLYSDLWGSALVEAARTLLREHLLTRSVLSDSFGPGYFGMRTTELCQLSQLIDLEQLGITLYKNQILLPQKSCAGLLFAVDNSYRKLNSCCAACLGTHSSCKLCNQNRWRQR